jgi:hypothetical protein
MTMNSKRLIPLLALFAVLTACNLPQATQPTPTFTPFPVIPTFTSAPALVTATLAPALTATNTQVPAAEATAPAAFCQDARVGVLLDSVGSALAASNGGAFAALISPVSGLDLQFIRSGRVVNYDREHAAFVFETTYQVEWGLSAGSGGPLTGSFQEIVLPSLQTVFTPSAQRVCNQIKLGSATYQAAWPSEYSAVNFYSVHFPGTTQFSGLDWETWLAGVEFANGQPYLRVLLHFEWEP